MSRTLAQTAEDAASLMATDLETERANLKMRDTWLENLGKEIDLKELELRKDKERIQSLEQMIKAYEREFKTVQETRDAEANLREKGMIDYIKAQGQLNQILRRPHENARGFAGSGAGGGSGGGGSGSREQPTPRLQLSARSARSREKENEGPPAV